MAAEFAAKVAAVLHVPGDSGKSVGVGGGSDGDMEVKEQQQQQVAVETDTSGQIVPQHPPGAPQHLATDDTVKRHPSPPLPSSAVIIEPPPPSLSPSLPAVTIDQQTAACDSSEMADVSVTCDTLSPVVSLAPVSTPSVTDSIAASVSTSLVASVPSPSSSSSFSSVPVSSAMSSSLAASVSVSAAVSVPVTSSLAVVEETGGEAGECDTGEQTSAAEPPSVSVACLSTPSVAVAGVSVSVSDAVSRADSETASTGQLLLFSYVILSFSFSVHFR